MRVALVHSFYSSAQPSGENAAVAAQAEILSKGGHEVTIIARFTDVEAERRSYPIRAALQVATGGGTSPLGQLTDFAPDVVHVHNLFPNFGTRWVDGWRGPIVTTLHNYRPLCAAATFFRDGESCHLCVQRGTHHAVLNGCYRGPVATVPLALANRSRAGHNRLLRRADRIVVLSSRARDEFTRFYDAENRVRMIPNFGLDEGCSLSRGVHDRWAYVGRLSEEKGIRQLIEHWPSSEMLDVYGDGPLLAELRERPQGSVTFHGQVAAHRVHSILSEARGLLFPSLWSEHAPMVYVEAMSAGCPVVARAGNSVADDLQGRDHGAVFTSWGEMSSVLAQVRDTWTSFAHASRSRYEESFSPQRWLETTESMYDELVSTSWRA